MGNNSSKSDRHDMTQLNNMSQGMNILRRSMESLPDGTRKFKLVLDSNEKKIQEILRRSTKGSTRKKALDMLRDFEDLKDKERNSIRDSSLDNGAVESSSIIAADVRKYDKNRQRDKNVDELHSIRRKVERLRNKIDLTYNPVEADELQKQLQVLISQLGGLQVQPKSRLQEYKDETKSVMRKCEKKLAEKQVAIANSSMDGVVMSKVQNSNSPPTEVVRARPQILIDVQNDISMIQGKVLSLQSECEKFDGDKDSPEYNMLVQTLMKLWDKVGKIKDEEQVELRDQIIGIISTTLKRLNRRCMDKTRGSLSKNKILSMTEVFHMQYQKIATWLHNGKIKETNQVYAILNEVQNGLYQLLTKNECQLVTTKMIDSNVREPWVHIYQSTQKPMETNFDKVYIQDEETDLQKPIKINKSCPNFSNLEYGSPQAYQQVRATYVPNNHMSTFKQHKELSSDTASNGPNGLMPVLDNLNYESITLKYAVEEFDANDKKKFEELDERLIEIYIQIEGLKGNCSAQEEQLRNNIMQRVQDTRIKLTKKCKTNSSDEFLLSIENILEHLEILKTQINESYDWDAENPEFKVLDDALKSALMQLDLHESNNNQRVEIAKQNAMSDVRQAIERLEMQKYKTSMAGTEV